MHSATIILPFNPNHINVSRKWELHMWSDQLHCTPEQLINVVKEVGCQPEDVKKRLALMKKAS